jgi:hypothetical protein
MSLWLPNLSLRAYPYRNGYFFFPTLVIQVSFLITPYVTSYPIFNPTEEDLHIILEFSYIGLAGPQIHIVIFRPVGLSSKGPLTPAGELLVHIKAYCHIQASWT